MSHKFYTYGTPPKGLLKYFFKPFGNFKQNLPPDDDSTAKIYCDTVLQFDNFDMNFKNLIGDSLDAWRKPNLHPILRVLIMIFLRNELISMSPFPWITQFGIWTIQIKQSYGGAINPCIVYWGVTKFRECFWVIKAIGR